MQKEIMNFEINGVQFPLRCKNCIEGKYYKFYMCIKCNLSKFEGF